MSRALFASFSASLVICAVAGCGGGGASAKPAGAGADAGGEDAAAHPLPVDPTLATQRGIIVDLSTKHAVGGATVTAGDQVTTTDASGAYSFTVRKGVPFQMVVTAPEYAKLIEQETTLDADFDRGKTNFVSSSTASLLLGSLAGYDERLGVLSVQLVPTGACASEGGAKVSVSPPGSALVRYFKGGLPTGNEAVISGEFPSAVIYNTDPGVPLSVTVAEGSCAPVTFPFTTDGVSYTGGISTEPGLVTSFTRVFLQ